MIHEFKARSDHSDPDESFKDLHWSNFILVAGHVACRKICQLELDPYPTGLLCQGLDKFGDDKHTGVEYLLGMEYSTAVGVMIMDVVADVNKQGLKNDCDLELSVEVANGRTDDVMMEIDIIHQWVESAKEDLMDVFQRLWMMEERVEGLKQKVVDGQRDVVMLIYKQTEWAEEQQL